MTKSLEQHFRSVRNAAYEYIAGNGQTVQTYADAVTHWREAHPFAGDIAAFTDQHTLGMIGALSMFSIDTDTARHIDHHEYAAGVLRALNITAIWAGFPRELIADATGPVVLYGNHTNRIEPLALFATIPRDTHIITASWTSFLGFDAKSHYVLRVPAEGKTVRHNKKTFSRDASIQFNADSYTAAGNFVAGGGAVMTFPNATHRMHKSERTWKGIGRLADMLPHDVFKKTIFLPLYFSGVSAGDVVRNLYTVVRGYIPDNKELRITSGKPLTGADVETRIPSRASAGAQESFPFHAQISEVIESAYKSDPLFPTI